MLGMIALASLCVLASWGCTSPGPPATPPRTNAAAWVEADTEMACTRSHSAAAWTQLVYRTPLWQDLAARADRRDPAAWSRIGDLIEHNLRHVDASACSREVLRHVRDSAARLSGSP